MPYQIKYSQAGSLVNVVTIDPRYAPVMKEIASGALPSDAEIIYRGRNCVYKISRGGQWLCVKAFRRPGALNSLIYTRFRDGKAKRSFDFSLRLLSMGIGAPDPIGYAEVKRSGRLRESYYVSLLLDAGNLRQWEEKPDADALLNAFAAEMVKIHRCGVLHKDFSPGNVLYSKDAEGRYRFYLIDLNRMEFGVRSHSRLMRNFRAINLDPAQTVRLARRYAVAAGLDEDVVAHEAADQLAAYFRSKKIHRALKRIFKKRRK